MEKKTEEKPIPIPRIELVNTSRTGSREVILGRDILKLYDNKESVTIGLLRFDDSPTNFTLFAILEAELKLNGVKVAPHGYRAAYRTEQIDVKLEIKSESKLEFVLPAKTALAIRFYALADDVKKNRDIEFLASINGWQERVLEVYNQLLENTITAKLAKEEVEQVLTTAYDLGEENGASSVELDSFSAYDIIAYLDEDTTTLTKNNFEALQTLLLRHKSDNPLVANNLLDEQKLEVLGEAMKKYSLKQLQSLLK